MWKAILVESEKDSLHLFRLECGSEFNIEIAASFSAPEKAIDYVYNNDTDIVILDTELAGMSGIELGRQLKKIDERIVLLFVSVLDKFAAPAYRLHAPVFLEKPYGRADVRFALDVAGRLLDSGEKSIIPKRKVFIHTFGSFEVLLDGKRIHFKDKKAKELLAILVDRKGAEVSNDQAITLLWENSVNNQRYQNRFRRVVKDLKDTLEEVGIGFILFNRYNSRSVNVKTFGCDYYWLLDGDETIMASYDGSYMIEYSWAEASIAELYRRFGR